MTKSTGILSVTVDTNVLVSSLLSNGNPALIVDLIAEEKIRPCFDDCILAEYWDVLKRPKFDFPPLLINRLIHDIVRAGFNIEVLVSSKFSMPDESDRKFYDVAKSAGAILITGNKKLTLKKEPNIKRSFVHYPDEPFVVTPAQFLTIYQQEVISGNSP